MTHGPNTPDDRDLAGVEPVLAEALEGFKQRAEQRAASWNVDAELRRAQARLQETERMHTPARSRERTYDARTSRGRVARWIQWGAGAAVVMLLGLSTYWWRATPTITRTYATGIGERRTFVLADGTRATLAPRTTLRLEQFGAKRRTVTLDGEAYFEGTHALGAPFVVRAGNVMTQVLGTSFLVRHYDDDLGVRVAVTAGKISVTTAGLRVRGITLVAGDAVEVLDSTIARASGGTGAATAWLHDELVLNDVPVPEVLAALSRWYGYHFRYADSTVEREKVTVWLNTRSSAKALATLQHLLDVSIAVSGDTVTLTPRHSETPGKTPRIRSYDTWTPTREVGR